MTRTYLDHAATTPMLPAARAAMVEACARWANPSSPHAEGRAARAALEGARARIKAALGWEHHLILTSGATEAIGIAMRAHGRGAFLASATEHDAVLRGHDGERLPIEAGGRVATVAGSPLAAALNKDDAIAGLAIQSVNSETGVCQPIAAIDALRAARARGALPLLCDCSQSAGKLPLPDADLIAVSAHKLGGPPGIGALLVKDLRLLEPTGGQEQGYRAGTENLPGALGFAAALEGPRDWFEGMAPLRNMLDAAIVAAGGAIVGGQAPRIPTIASYRMPGRSAQAQLIAFDLAGFAVSAGSACSSGSMRPSHVLAAMGWSGAAAGEVIRVSFGWTTTADDVARFAAAWRGVAEGRRRAA